METKNRQKLLLIVAGVGLLLLVGNSIVFEPLVAAWKARSKRIADLRDQVAQGQQLVQRETALRYSWESKRTNALPSDQSAAEAQLFNAFDRWERASGISRVSIKPQWKQGEDDSYATLECRADYNGDIGRIKSFLYQLENDPIGLKLENVEIAARDDAGQQLTLGLQVSGLQLNPPTTSQQP